MNIGAGEGLQDVLKSNLGPSGTLKMYVSTFGLFYGNEMALTKSQVGGWCRRSMWMDFSLRYRVWFLTGIQNRSN